VFAHRQLLRLVFKRNNTLGGEGLTGDCVLDQLNRLLDVVGGWLQLRQAVPMSVSAAPSLDVSCQALAPQIYRLQANDKLSHSNGRSHTSISC
jgi:hypothetical protein